MAKKYDARLTGLALGILFAIMHSLWVIGVASGISKKLAAMWHSAHFLSDMHSFAAFSLGTAIAGIISAFIVGYAIGWSFAAIYNWLNDKAG